MSRAHLPKGGAAAGADPALGAEISPPPAGHQAGLQDGSVEQWSRGQVGSPPALGGQLAWRTGGRHAHLTHGSPDAVDIMPGISRLSGAAVRELFLL